MSCILLVSDAKLYMER